MNVSVRATTWWKRVTGLARQLLGRGLAALGKLLKGVPRVRLVFWGAFVLLLAGWWIDHQARLRQAIELAQLHQQTAATVSALQAQAAAAIRAANERNLQAIHELEAKRTDLESKAGGLTARVQSLQAKERARAAQLATLPSAELARRVVDELAALDSGPGMKEGGRNSKLETRNSDRLSVPAPTPDSPLPTPAFSLTEPQLRRVAAVLADRAACREQKQVTEAQFTNCRAQVDTNAAIIQRQSDSLAQLNQALTAKDEILAQREVKQKADLKAARGSRLTRLGRFVEYVALGMVMGVVLR